MHAPASTPGSVARDCELLIVGAGPAGLAAAYAAVQRGMAPLVIERHAEVGGLARTLEHAGLRFDLGGHRFFTKDPAIEALWRELLGAELLEVERRSRIHYRGRWFDYPLQPLNALAGLGLGDSLQVLGSYASTLFGRRREVGNLEDWLVQRFGRRLYEIFFKTYTEKLWGRPVAELHADWASQRIRGLSLARAVIAALSGRTEERSLTDRFLYPRLGPGQMWQQLAARIEAGGGEIWTGTRLTALQHDAGRVQRATLERDGTAIELAPQQLISSIPLAALLERLQPAPPAAVREAAAGLEHRAYLLVQLLVEAAEPFADQWIYVHDPEVQVGRIQNTGNWSAAMAPDPGTSSLGLEYFCETGDALWRRDDAELLALAGRELEQLGLARADQVRSGQVVREAHAYPVYSLDYPERLARVRQHLDGLANLQTVGRSGRHRYGNMDHAMASGQAAVARLAGEAVDVWQVDDDADHLEALPARTRQALQQTFARLDAPAFAVASALVAGLGMFAATLWLVIKGGPVVGPHLELLAQYFIGYTVTLRGAFVAFGYSALWGLLLGWMFAYLRNLLLAVYIYRSRRRIELWTLRKFFEHF